MANTKNSKAAVFAGMGDTGSKEEKKMLGISVEFHEGGKGIKWQEHEKAQFMRLTKAFLVKVNRKFTRTK